VAFFAGTLGPHLPCLGGGGHATFWRLYKVGARGGQGRRGGCGTEVLPVSLPFLA
jgi:hypothetical protein